MYVYNVMALPSHTHTRTHVVLRSCLLSPHTLHYHHTADESLAPAQTTSSFLGATLSSLPGIGSGGTSNAAPASAPTAAATTITSTDSRFILYLTQALEARRAAARAAAEEEELLVRQLPAALDEVRSYVLNTYEPPEMDDGSGNGCVPGTCIPVAGGQKGRAAHHHHGAAAAIATMSPSPRSPSRGSGIPSLRHSAQHHHHRRHAAPAAGTDGNGALSVRVIPYPPTAAPRECALARVLWRQFQGFMEFYYEDAASSAFDLGEEDAVAGDEATRLRRQRQQQQYRQQLHQLLQQPLMMQTGDGGGNGGGGYASLLDDEDFRAWSKSGGLFLEHILLMIRYRLWEEEDCCLFFLDVVTKFLEDGLARVRREGAARFDAQRLIKLVHAEVRATQRKQHALQALDAHTVLMALVAQAAQPSLGPASPAAASAAASSSSSSKAFYLLKVMPRVLRFGARLMATGNRAVQESIMDFQDRATVELLVQRKFCVGLRSLLRFCRYQVETLMYSSSSLNAGAGAAGAAAAAAAGVGGGATEAEAFARLVMESQPTLELITTLFDFLGALCAGHNMRARTFLREQRVSGDTVNLVAEAASLVSTTCSYARTLMTYLQNRTFAAKVAPPVHPSQGACMHECGCVGRLRGGSSQTTTLLT
jgi:hypothetical protein